jgi:phage-related tail protein
MASFNKYNIFVENLAEKVHNLASDTLKVALTNTAPNAASHTVLANISEIAAGNGYTAGGNQTAQSSSSQTGGVYTLVSGDPSTWTAAGGSIGPFRYAVLYNATAAGGPLIGWWDYGSSITLGVGETFTVDLGASTLTLT